MAEAGLRQPEQAAVVNGASTWDRVRASLMQAALFAPTVAAAVAVVAYSQLLRLPNEGPVLTENKLLGALVILLITWLALAMLDALLGLSSRERANATSYQLLRSRLDSLRDRCSGVRPLLPATSEQGQTDGAVCQRLALQEFTTQVKAIGEQIDRDGPQWVTGNEYIALWRRVHRAEEAWLYLEPMSDLTADYQEARLRLSGSKVKETQPAGLLSTLDQVKQDLDAGKEVGARATLSRVWRALHEYRDSHWDSLRQSRNQLLLAIGLGSLSLYTVLWLAMLGGVAKETIQWASAVYLVGAGVGLFNRLYRQSRTTSVNDDYGLSTARLLADPQLSGTAAIVGVLVSALGGASTSGNSVQFADAFNLTLYPANLVLAAVFGLTPSLLFERLTQAEENKEAIKATESGRTVKEGG